VIAGNASITERFSMSNRIRTGLLIAGALVLLGLVYRLGAESVAAALTRVTWWQFLLVCLIHGVNVALDTYGWRYALTTDRASFRKLLAARCAGDAANVLTAVASVGGEAIKAWVLRREIPLEKSVPSLIVSKTAEVVAQALLLVLGIALAFTTDAVGGGLRTVLLYMLLGEVLAVGGFLGVQVAGMVGRAGRLLSWAGGPGGRQAQRLDEALRDFYRHQWERFAMSVACFFVGWLVGVAQALLILDILGLPATVVTATVIEALWSGVRFATFFIPASLGPLEGANAAAFDALGYSAAAGLAFTLVRRASQVVWIALGVVILIAMRPTDEVVGAPNR
jgi:uncharacterized membrane protein YbhN (UPF0104 family)